MASERRDCKDQGLGMGLDRLGYEYNEAGGYWVKVDGRIATLLKLDTELIGEDDPRHPRYYPPVQTQR